MKEVKFAVAGLAVLGIIGSFLPMVSFGGMSINFWKIREVDGGQFWLVMAGFLVPLVMGVLATVQGAMVRWQASTAAAFSALAVLKLRDAFDGAIGAKLMFIAAILGLVAAIVAAAKPETSA